MPTIKSTLQPNVIALLEVYEQAIQEFISVILPISTEDLNKIRDFDTKDEDCKSIKSIVEHVIFSGYAYTYYYTSLLYKETPRPIRKNYGNSAAELQKELNKMYEHCELFFIQNPHVEIEETKNENKIITKWGQMYDIDQLFEHSIVHILRHKRQINNFLKQENK